MHVHRYLTLALLLPFSAVAQSAATPAPLSVAYGDLTTNPQLYDGKEIKIGSKVSLGFEDSTIYNTKCNKRPEVWLMFGGDVTTPIMPMWGDRTRPSGANIKFKGVEYPLEKDNAFLDFYTHITKREQKKALYRVTAAHSLGQIESKTQV
jgi:hypothetical protein